MLDLTKPVQRRDGGVARLICTDVKDERAILSGQVTSEKGVEIVFHHYPDGRCFFGENNAYDLVNVPEPPRVHVRYFNVYRSDYDADGVRTGSGVVNRRIADEHSVNRNRIACKRVEFTEGEFDE
jgi:hypothetical protein